MASSLRSLRTVSRSLPIRPFSSSRTVAVSTLRAVSRTGAVPAQRNFSTSRAVLGSGESDLPLAQKLKEELQYEKESAAADAYAPAFLEAFKKDGVWTIEDKAGNDEIALTRQFGNESIRLVFSIADIDTNPEDPEFEGEEGVEPEEDAQTSYPVRVSITVAKADKGALAIDSIVQDGAFVVENISFYKDGKLATDVTAEADWKRRGLYIGPQFDHLDVSVQELFEQYLDERGINSSLALFIPEYAELKEQREYVKWIEHVKDFVEV